MNLKLLIEKNCIMNFGQVKLVLFRKHSEHDFIQRYLSIFYIIRICIPIELHDRSEIQSSDFLLDPHDLKKKVCEPDLNLFYNKPRRCFLLNRINKRITVVDILLWWYSLESVHTIMTFFFLWNFAPISLVHLAK